MANDFAKIQLPNGTIADIRSNKLPYGVCSTAAATADKTVNIGNAFTLEAGSVVIVNFSITNTAAVANLTLNVNSSGAKAIKYRNQNLSSADILSADRSYQFVYDGTCWQLIGDLDTNTTYNVATTSADGLMSSTDKLKLDGLVDTMQFKGTLGAVAENPTITSLPTAAASNKGYTYKVVTAGTYAEMAAKVGDLFISNGSEWNLVPSGDESEDTWRAITVNGSSFLSNAISTPTLNLSAGTNIGLETNSNGTVTISATNTNRQLNLYYDDSAHTVVSSANISTPLTFSAGTNVSIGGNSNGTFTFSATNTNREIKMVYDGTTFTIIGPTDTSPITFLPGSNVTLDGNTSNKTITINAANTARATGSDSFITSSSFSWSAGTVPSFGSAITADDITSWSQGTLPAATLSEAVLTFTAGTLPSLSYSEKSIPNVTSAGTAPTLSWSTASAVTSVGT